MLLDEDDEGGGRRTGRQPHSPAGSRPLCELLEEGILGRGVFFGLWPPHQSAPQAPRPPGLDIGPFRHELNVVLLIAAREPDVLAEMMRCWIHEHPPGWRLDPDPRFQRLNCAPLLW